MSLFSVVQFPNEECTGSAATSTYGTCYTRHGAFSYSAKITR